jgi:hypothetical protein
MAKAAVVEKSIFFTRRPQIIRSDRAKVQKEDFRTMALGTQWGGICQILLVDIFVPPSLKWRCQGYRLRWPDLLRCTFHFRFGSRVDGALARAFLT